MKKFLLFSFLLSIHLFGSGSYCKECANKHLPVGTTENDPINKHRYEGWGDIWFTECEHETQLYELLEDDDIYKLMETWNERVSLEEELHNIECSGGKVDFWEYITDFWSNFIRGTLDSWREEHESLRDYYRKQYEKEDDSEGDEEIPVNSCDYCFSQKYEDDDDCEICENE